MPPIVLIYGHLLIYSRVYRKSNNYLWFFQVLTRVPITGKLINNVKHDSVESNLGQVGNPWPDVGRPIIFRLGVVLSLTRSLAWKLVTIWGWWVLNKVKMMSVGIILICVNSLSFSVTLYGNIPIFAWSNYWCQDTPPPTRLLQWRLLFWNGFESQSSIAR